MTDSWLTRLNFEELQASVYRDFHSVMHRIISSGPNAEAGPKILHQAQPKYNTLPVSRAALWWRHRSN